jgi:hypothetical protein
LFHRKTVWKKVKARVMENMIIPTMLDGVENCAISSKMMSEMETAYMRMVRSCLRITPHTQRKFRISSEKLLWRLGVKPLHYYVDLKVLAYAGHVVRMAATRLTRIVRHGVLCGSKRRGRPCKNISDNVQEGLIRKHISVHEWETFAMDKGKWAAMIRNDCNKNARIKVNRPPWKPDWTRAPEDVVGCLVEKQFQHKWVIGTIVYTDIDIDTNDVIWRINYDDDDCASEDCKWRELQSILCLDLPDIL